MHLASDITIMSDEAWICTECEYENEAGDAACAACDAARPQAEADGPYKGIKVGLVLTCEQVWT